MSEVTLWNVNDTDIWKDGKSFGKQDGVTRIAKVVLRSDHLATVQALEATVRELEGALSQAPDDIVWMSGADDFSPDGKAINGWRKVQIHLDRFNKLTRKPQ